MCIKFIYVIYCVVFKPLLDLGLHFYTSVITWLNKQLNENQLSRKQEALGMFETPAPGLRTGSVSHNLVICLI